MERANDAGGGDLAALLGMLRRRGWIVLLAVLATALGALGLSKLQSTSYTGSSTLLFQRVLLDVQVTGLPLTIPSDPQREAETQERLASQSDVFRLAAQRLGPSYTASALEKNVDVKAQGKSNLVEISATAGSPDEAARIANRVAEAVVASRRDAIDQQLAVAIDKVRTQLRQLPKKTNVQKAQRALISTNLTKLQLLRAVDTADVQVSNPAVPPTKPSAPKTTRNVLLGALLGLLIGLALAIVAEALDRRVRRTDDLEDALGLPILAAVPRSRSLGRTPWRSYPGEREREAFRRLRASLRYYGKDDGADPVHSILVTSAGSGTGKTTVALHLASAVAASGSRVLLVEADFRRPRLARLLDLPTDCGLTDVLGQHDEDDAPLPGVFTVRPEHGASANGANGHGPRGDGSFAVLPAGPVSADASELLDSAAMRNLLAWAREEYDLVIIDGPPPALVSDAVPLVSQVDGVVVVSRLGRESRAEVEKLREDLARLRGHPLGAVATFTAKRRNPYLPAAG